MKLRAIEIGSAAGAVASALGSAAAAVCCIGPLALTLLGVNGMIMAAGLKPYRFYLLAVAAGLIATAWWSLSARGSRGRPTCSVRAGRIMRRIVWFASILWTASLILQFTAKGAGY